MTVQLFATLAASVALAILLVVELKVPLGGVRRWLQQGPHVETTDETHGPWYVVRWSPGGEEYRDDGHRSPGAAAAELSAGERVRSWLAEMWTCPYCAGGWLSLLALALAAIEYGADVLWYWPAVWVTSAFAVVVARAVGNLP